MLQNQARYRECGVFWDYKITLDTPDIEYNSWMLLEVEERDY